VQTAIAKDSKRRYQSAEAMAADLGRFLAGEPIRARRVRLLERGWLWARRYPTRAALVATAFVLALVLAIGLPVTGAIQRERDVALDSQARAERAEKNVRLREHLAQAVVRRRSGQRGQRFKGLAQLSAATKLDPTPELRRELRNEALACLVLPDLETVQEWDGWPLGSNGFGFNATLERYAIGDKDGAVRVCRTGDGTELMTLPGAGQPIGYGGLSFSPDGRFLYRHMQQPGRKVGAPPQLWRLGDGPAAFGWDAPPDIAGVAAFAPDSTLLAVSYLDGSVRIFDTATGNETKRLAAGLHPTAVAFCPTQPHLAVVDHKVVKIFERNTGKLLGELEHPAAVGDIDWHPGGQLLATACNDLKVRLWRATEGKPALPPMQGQNYGLRVQFTREGDRLISNDWSSSMRVWDTATGRLLLSTVCNNHAPRQIELGDHGSAEIVGHKLRKLRFASGRELRTLTARDGSFDQRFFLNARPSPDGRFLLVNSLDRLAFVDWSTGAEVAWIPLPHPTAFAFEPGGAFVTSGLGPAGLLRWPTREERGVWRVGPPQSLNQFSNPDGHGSSADASVLAIPYRNEGAVVLHRLTGRRVKLGPQEDVRTCAVSPDGRWIATGNHSNLKGIGFTVWNAQTGKADKEFNMDGSWAAFSPDGNWLLTAGGSHRLWNVGTWEEGPSLKKNDDFSTSVAAFTADSKMVALTGEQGQVRLVEVVTGAEIARLTVPEQTHLAPQCFSRNGSQLVAIGANRLMYIWDLRLLRSELAELDLDWEWPEFPPAGPPLPPLKVEVDLGFLRRTLNVPHEHAVAAYTISLAHLPFNPDAYLNRGLAHGQLKQMRQAIADYGMFLAVTSPSGPRRAEILFRRSTNYLNLKDDAAALADLLALAELDTRSLPWAEKVAERCNDSAWKLLVCPEKERQPEKALRLARKAIDCEPDNIEYRGTLGLAYYRLGQFHKAAIVFEKNANEDKAEHAAFADYFLATTYCRLGEVMKAKASLNRAVHWHDAHRRKLSEAWQKRLQHAQVEAEHCLVIYR
jgi:WD40 repeat protein